MFGLFARLRKRRQDRFFATMPQFVQRDPEWVLEAFRRDMGREFNPYSYDDRELITLGIATAMIRALPILFGRKAA